MKKFNLLIALALFAGIVAMPSAIANAQDDKAAQQAEFERNWYDTCFIKKDNDKCLVLCKEMLEKYPGATPQYIATCKTKLANNNLKLLYDRFQASLQAYYKTPDAMKLDQLFAAGDDYLKAQPGQQYVIGQLALAGANGVMGQFYKNMDRVKGYAEQGLKTFDATGAPEGWKPEEWTPMRELVQAQMNQYLGYRLTETKGSNQDEALAYLAKATQVKNKEGAGWKDPNNYWLRSKIYSKQYDELRSQYDKLADDQKTGDVGKDLLTKVNQLLDTKLIPEYARVIASATKPEAKDLLDAAKQLFDSFWKYRTDAPDKAPAFLKAFEADPTVAGPEVPAKVETAENMAAPAAPTTGAANVKLSAGGGAPGAAPGAKGAANGNGKAAPAAKGKPAKGKRRR